MKKKVVIFIAAIGGSLLLLAVYANLSAKRFPVGSPESIGLAIPSPVSSTGGFALPEIGLFKDASAPALESTSRGGADTVVSEGDLTQRKVVRNGSLSLLVENVAETAERIKTLARDADGFVQDSRIYAATETTKAGYVTIRIPSDRFDDTMETIKALSIDVEDESTNARDVTEQFVDLEAQLRNLRAEEVQYLDILTRARTVEDTLLVVQKLNSVRGRIERIEGQLKYLSRQVDMSTITVSLTAEEDVEVLGLRWRPLVVVKQAFNNMVRALIGFADALIGFVFFLPVLVAWIIFVGIIVLVGWKVVRRVRQRVGGTAKSENEL